MHATRTPLYTLTLFFLQVHMLHLVPQWQSAERHRKLKVMMQVVFLFIFAAMSYNVNTERIEIV